MAVIDRTVITQVFEALGQRRESLEEHLAPMLRWVEYPPVSETLMKLLACPSASGIDNLYQVIQLSSILSISLRDAQ